MTGLEALEQWVRKRYSFEFKSGTYLQIGDESSITLKGGGREVTVSEVDMACEAPGDDMAWPTLEELMAEALRRWHADPSPKAFRVLLEFGGGLAPEPVAGFSQRWCHNDSLMCYVTAANDAGAVAACEAVHPGSRSQHASENAYVPPQIREGRVPAAAGNL
jgi:hypothetical protein